MTTGTVFSSSARPGKLQKLLQNVRHESLDYLCSRLLARCRGEGAPRLLDADEIHVALFLLRHRDDRPADIDEADMNAVRLAVDAWIAATEELS